MMFMFSGNYIKNGLLHLKKSLIILLLYIGISSSIYMAFFTSYDEESSQTT